MIRIIHDPEGLISGTENLCIDSISDYPHFVADILTSLKHQQDYSLIVRQAIILQWFKNMASRYPQGTFSFEVIDAREALVRRLGVYYSLCMSPMPIFLKPGCFLLISA
jgi:hypothetical protein